MTALTVVKAHAFGNDFLLVDARAVPDGSARPALARALCERHRGLGGDGVIFYTRAGLRGRFDLLNADGSYSELSGNGVRCLAAWFARSSGAASGTTIVIDTDAGEKHLRLLSDGRGARLTFRAAMGQPERVAKEIIDVGGQPVEAVTLRVGNPQCVVLGEVSEARLHSLASALAVHPHFPEGTNVELATVEAPGRVRILIWERGVGPTEASGTGACASAVAAMSYGGASRDVEVVSPGGAQRVEWTGEGLFLTGWAEVVAEARWLKDAP
jgi:diaminopimelate epimerase